MNSVIDIEKAVERLPPDQLAAFRAWFEAFEAVRFDTRIAKDAAAGKLDHLAAEALTERDQGMTREL